MKNWSIENQTNYFNLNEHKAYMKGVLKMKTSMAKRERERDNEYAVIMRNHNINKENTITAAKCGENKKRRRFHALRRSRIVGPCVDVTPTASTARISASNVGAANASANNEADELQLK